MLRILLRELKETRESPIEPWICLTRNPDYFLERWGDTKHIYAPKNERDINKLVNYFDEIIVGGGAHIDDSNSKSLSFTPNLIRVLSLKMISQGKIVRWRSVSSNKTLTDLNYISDLNKIINCSVQFTIRDPLSLDTLLKAGINTDTIKFEEDPVLRINTKQKTLLIILSALEETNTIATLVLDIVNFCKRSSSQWQLCFVPFFNLDHCDRILYEKLFNSNLLQTIPHFMAPEFTYLETLKPYFETADIVFSMKYHASLLAMMHKKPVITYCVNHRHYQNKITWLHEYFKNPHLIDARNYHKGDLEQELLRIHQFSYPIKTKICSDTISSQPLHQ